VEEGERLLGLRLNFGTGFGGSRKIVIDVRRNSVVVDPPACPKILAWVHERLPTNVRQRYSALVSGIVAPQCEQFADGNCGSTSDRGGRSV